MEVPPVDAVILAGGYGTRMWPITSSAPKMLFPLGSSTVLDRLLAALDECDRVGHVYLSTNRRFAEVFEKHLAATDADTVSVSVEDSTTEAEKLGAVGALAALVDREGLEDDTVVVAGDNVFGFDFTQFVDRFDAGETPILAAHDVGSTERARNYGVVQLAGDSVVDLVEKPDDPVGTWVSTGCYGLPASTLPLLETYLDGGSHRDQIGWFLRWLVDERTCRAYCFDDAWFDVGSKESYLRAVSWALDGESYVAETATVTGSTVDANSVVAANAVVDGATLSGTVVFPGATVRGSEVRNSVIAPGAILERQHAAGALLGSDAASTDRGSGRQIAYPLSPME